MDTASHLIAIDWGTSSLRAALMDRDGAILDKLQATDGIMAMQGRDYAMRAAELFGPWLARAGDAVMLASGMVGSRQGWCEAPYAPCPAGFGDLARGIVWIGLSGGRRVGIVPGIVAEDGNGRRDVIRGEEIQVFGALRLSGDASGVFVLPGTHSKWVRVEDGRIIGFRTFMTGEIFGLLKQHSILGRLMPTGEEGEFSPDAFDAGWGAALADASGSILNSLFSVRTAGLFEQFRSEELASYLSGLLIGEEIREARALLGGAVASRVHLVCREDLARAYRRCLSATGTQSEWIDDAAFTGLFALARANDLIA